MLWRGCEGDAFLPSSVGSEGFEKTAQVINNQRTVEKVLSLNIS